MIRCIYEMFISKWYLCCFMIFAAIYKYIFTRILIYHVILIYWDSDKIAAFFQTTFKKIFLNENVWISMRISLKFVPRGPINKIPALFQIMVWCWPGDKPLSEPMRVSLPMHICVTWPQWVNNIICLVFKSQIVFYFYHLSIDMVMIFICTEYHIYDI